MDIFYNRFSNKCPIPAPMTKEIFNEKWGEWNKWECEDDNELQKYVEDAFQLYEQSGFIEKFDSPYDDNGEHNGMGFEVLRRATVNECDLEVLPVWLVRFENGDEAYCYPEEIAVIEH